MADNGSFAGQFFNPGDIKKATQHSISQAQQQISSFNEAIIQHLFMGTGVPKVITPNENPSDSQRDAALSKPTLVCPKCGRSAEFLASAAPMIELPSEIEKVWSTMPAIITRQRSFNYVLGPCGCTVNALWAAAWGHEVNRRLKGSTPNTINLKEAVDLAFDRKVAIADLTELYKMRDDEKDPTKLKCVEHAVVMLTQRMIDAANARGKIVHNAHKPAVGNAVAQWAADNNLSDAIANPPKKVVPKVYWDEGKGYEHLGKLPALGPKASVKPKVNAGTPALIHRVEFPDQAGIFEESDGVWVAICPGMTHRSFSSFGVAYEYLASLKKAKFQQELIKTVKIVNEEGQKSGTMPTANYLLELGISMDDLVAYLGDQTNPKTVKVPSVADQAKPLPREVTKPTPLPPDPQAARKAFFAKHKRSKRRIQTEE